LNLYGKLKLEGEQYIRANLEHYVIARTTNVFAWDPETQTPNFLMHLVNTLKENDRIKVPGFLYGNPTYAGDLAAGIMDLIAHKHYGLYHIVGSEYINRYDWAVKCIEMAGIKGKTIEKIETPPADMVPRPLKSHLDTGKFRQVSNIKLHNVEEGLKIFIRSRQGIYNAVIKRRDAKNMAKLTVLMTVYNGEGFLRETVDSILNQTYKDFKFLIIDNASTDSSREVIQSYNDPRIELVALPENIGQFPALNKGLDMIDTPLVARMDADDISLPRRFERQAAFMGSHPGVGVCGTYAAAFSGKNETLWKHPVHHADIKVRLLFECCLVHPSVMIRKDLFDKYELRYNEQIGHSEDWELWQRAGRLFNLANIPEVLVRYRVHSQSVSRQTLNRQQAAAEMLDNSSLRFLDLSHHPLRNVHRDVAFETFNAKNRKPEFIDNVVQWFWELRFANYTHRVYDKKALNRFLKKRLFIVLTNNTRHRGKVFKTFFKEKLYRYIPLTWSLKFMLKLLLAVFH
jgi:glycosyltransferase involved in cell wall biosynthesis